MERLNEDFIKKHISRLGFGLMRLPTLGDDSKIDIAEMKKLVDAYMDAGLNYFDTAYIYHGGQSELAFKEAVQKRFPRDSYFVADKMPIWCVDKESEVEKVFNDQLEKTGVAYFDFYLIHSLNEEHYNKCLKFGVFEFAKKMKTEGKIKHIGFSFHGTYETYQKILENQPEMEFVQLQINYLDWEDIRSDKLYHDARKKNLPIIVMEPVRGGSLANLPKEVTDIFKKANPKASIASWAIRYAASLDGVMTVLSGMSNMEQVTDNASYMNMKDFKPLSADEQAVIEKAVVTLRKIPTVPCTACKYCIDCPIEIPIHEVFSHYNEYLNKKDARGFSKKYEQIEEGKRAGDCIQCGACTAVCPQNIQIPELFEKIAAFAKS